MKRSLVITAATLLMFMGCTEDKKDTVVEQAPKQEIKTDINQANTTEQKKVEDKSNQADKKIEDAKKDLKEEQKIVEQNIQETKAVDAEVLFKTCASCHGQKGEKEALGKSQVITGWDKDRVIKALNGYKDGSYGGVMKGIMKPHVESKTNEEIEALATFISNL